MVTYTKNVSKLKPKQLKNLNPREWICSTCNASNANSNGCNDSSDDEVLDLNDSIKFDITNVDLQKYDNMIFNPLKFDCNSIDKCYNDVINSNNDDIHECTYLTPDRFCSDSTASSGTFNFLNVNIRSLSKNFDKLKECLKTLNL